MRGACSEHAEHLSAYADGELDAAGARRVEEHVATCSACRDALREWREADAALAASSPRRSDVEWERLAQRVETAIDAASAEDEDAEEGHPSAAPSGGPMRRWLWGGSGALVAAALVLMFWPWISQQTADTPPSLPRARSAQPVEEAPASLPQISSSETGAAPPDGEAKDVRRVAVAPKTVGTLSDAPIMAPATEQEARAKEAPAEKQEVAGALAAMDADRAERSAPTEPVAAAEAQAPRTAEGKRSAPAIDSLRERTGLALSTVRSADEATSGSTKSLQRRPAVQRSNGFGSDTQALDEASERDMLRELAAEWERFLADGDPGDEREQALAAVVQLRDRLVQLDPENECAAALLAAQAWRRDGAGNLEANSAAERIERTCGSR